MLQGSLDLKLLYQHCRLISLGAALENFETIFFR